MDAFIRKTVIAIIFFMAFAGTVQAEEMEDKSITVNIYYTGTNGNARKFADEMETSGIASLIRQKNGNLRYDYFYPRDDKETVLLIDSWKNQAELDAHHASDLMPKIMELRNKYDLHMRVERYISDENGLPAADKKFIRK